MTVELELPDLLTELAEAHHVGPPPPLELTRPHVRSGTPAGRNWIAIVGVAAGAVGLVTGLTVLATYRGAGSRPADQPPATTSTVDLADRATVLAPAPGSDVALRRYRSYDLSDGAVGALVAPDGTVFGISVGPSDGAWLPDDDMWRSIPADRRDVAVVAGFEVAAVVDASAPTQIYRTVRHPCLAVSVPTAGELMWSPDLLTLLTATMIDDTGLVVDLPSGWRSLGAGRMLRSWMLDLTVTMDGAEHSVTVLQVANAPVGYVLNGNETNPRPIEHQGAEWWIVDIATTPGRTEVAGPTQVGAVRATSDLTADQLLAVIDSLVLTPIDKLDELVDPADLSPADVDEAVEVAESGPRSTPEACESLDIGIEIREP